MHQTMFEKRKVEILILWVIPGFAWLISLFYWFSQDSLKYFGYLSLMTFVFAFIAVGIAAGPLKLWRWNHSILPQALLIHRPWVYSGYFSLLFVCVGRLLTLPTTLPSLVETTLVTSFLGMILGCLHDTFGVDVGLYRVSGRNFDQNKYGTILVVARYGFYYFSAISLLMGLAAKIGYYFLYESPAYSWFVLAMLSGVLASSPILIWGASRFLVRRKTASANKYH